MFCAKCGNEFFSDHWNAKFCCVRCKDKAMDERRRERARAMAAGHDVPSRGRLHGAALEAAVKEAERILDEREGKAKPQGSGSINYTELLNYGKKDKK